MNKINNWTVSILAIFLLCYNTACKENEVTNDQDELVVRLDDSPETLNPILSTYRRDGDVNEYMYISLGDYDPISLELIPVLIREIPQARKIASGPYTGGDAFDLQIKKGASWSDGSPITGRDILFTFKMAAHPDVLSSGWKAMLEDIYDVTVDERDPSKFTVLTSGSYFLNMEVFLSAEIYPQYLYEGSEAMDAISLTELLKISTKELESKFPNISKLGKEFSSTKYKKEIVEGAGPYELTEWNSEQYIVLSKKKNYWGDQYSENSYLQGHYERIIFQIIPDETVALTLLKNDEIDVLELSKSSFMVFKELSEILDDDIETFSSNSTANNMILMNNQAPLLKDKRIREILVTITDVQRIINQLEGGAGLRINSIINPNKPAFKKDLPMPNFDIAKANKLLDEASWKDTDGDQIRDKIINGEKVQLSLDFLITSSATSEGISSIFVQDAKEVGIEIKPVIKKFPVILKEHIRKGDYDLSVFRSISSIASDDPYISWHSSSIGVEGQNYTGYSNPSADKVIDQIRKLDITTNERMKAYHELQDIMSSDYPVIFLYSPLGRFAIDDDIVPVISLKRPGVFVNAFKNKE